MASPRNNVYTHKEFKNDDDHPLVTEMFGELYFRESPNSSLNALFAAIDSRAAAAAAAVQAEPAAVAEKSAAPVEVNAPPRGGDDSGDNGDGSDHTPEQASSAPN